MVMLQSCAPANCFCFQRREFYRPMPVDRIGAEAYRKIHLSTQEGYRLAFLLKHSGGETGSVRQLRNLHRLDESGFRRKSWRLTLFIFGPDGELVRDASVVFSIVCPHNVHIVDKGAWGQAACHVEFEAAHDGVYRVETEIVTGGRLLVDGFTLEILQDIGRRSP